MGVFSCDLYGAITVPVVWFQFHEWCSVVFSSPLYGEIICDISICSIASDWSRFDVFNAVTAGAASTNKSASQLDRRRLRSVQDVCHHLSACQPSTKTTYSFHAGMPDVLLNLVHEFRSRLFIVELL